MDFDAEHGRVVNIERDVVDGRPATAQQLARLAAFGFGHFTTMPLRQGAVPGLDLHLTRLERASCALFDQPLPSVLVREYLRIAVEGLSDAWLRISVTATNWNARTMPQPAELQIWIQVRAAAVPRGASMRLQSVVHERYRPEIKHSAMLDVFDLRRQAQAAGFDDVLLLDRAGRVCEGSTWSLGAILGNTLIWPEAPRLEGTTMQLLQKTWCEAGGEAATRVLELDALHRMDVLFCCNAGGLWPVTAVNGIAHAADRGHVERLQACLAQAPASVP